MSSHGVYLSNATGADTQASTSGSQTQKVTLGKAEACHQCRKRKVVRSSIWQLMLGSGMTNWDEITNRNETEEEASFVNLHRLEARVEELEELIKSGRKEPLSPHGLQTSYISTDFFQQSSPTFSPSPPLPLLVEDWPQSLPSKTLVLHLIELFFTCWPNSRRLIHRPTFYSQLMQPPSSPHFPFFGLLHAICAAAAVHSPYVTVAPLPDLRKRPTEDIFQEKTRLLDTRMLSFDEEQYLLSKYQCMESARQGEYVIGVIQACVINTWWSFSYGRWFDVWAMSSLAIRLCNASGLNFSDSLHDPIPEKTRKKLLVDRPQSHADVELRRNIFWLAYSLQRYHLFVSHWPFDINDEDIYQTLPGTLEAFESGVDDGQERQNILSSDLFTSHGSNIDDFGLYIKCSVMFSRVHVLRIRNLPRYDSLEEVRESHEMETIDAIIASMKSSILKTQFQPNEKSGIAVSNLFIAHMAPQLATVVSHADLANWSDPSCESANKALAAARSIMRYFTSLMSTSWDCSRLDRFVCMCCSAAGRIFLCALQHAPESLSPILRAELRLIRNGFLMAGGRVILFLRQRMSFDLEIIEQLGEREAAKIFKED